MIRIAATPLLCTLATSPLLLVAQLCAAEPAVQETREGG
jgi:hypothetical protein